MYYREGSQARISQSFRVSERALVRLETGWINRGFSSTPGNPSTDDPHHFHMGEDYGYRMDYLELASLAEFGQPLPGRGKVYGLMGPYAGIRQSCQRATGKGWKPCSNFKDFDPGIALGAGLRYRVPYYKVVLSVEVLRLRGFRSIPFIEHPFPNDIHNKVLVLQFGFSKAIAGE